MATATRTPGGPATADAATPTSAEPNAGLPCAVVSRATSLAAATFNTNSLTNALPAASNLAATVILVTVPATSDPAAISAISESTAESAIAALAAFNGVNGLGRLVSSLSGWRPHASGVCPMPLTHATPHTLDRRADETFSGNDDKGPRGVQARVQSGGESGATPQLPGLAGAILARSQ